MSQPRPILEINHKIRIGPPEFAIEDLSPSYVASTDIDLGLFSAVRPDESTRLARLTEGDPIQVCAFFESGVMRAHTTVAAREESPIPSIAMSIPDRWERVQRREHVRIATSLAIQWEITGGSPDESETAAGEGLSVDFSAGGVRFRTSKTLSVGDGLKMKISIPGCPLEVCGWVVREEEPAARTREWIYAVEFCEIPIEIEDRMVSFVFSEQMRLRRDGLLD